MLDSAVSKKGRTYGMHAVMILRQAWDCVHIIGIHKVNAGLLCGVMGYKYSKRTSEAPMTRTRGAKQAITEIFVETLTLR